MEEIIIKLEVPNELKEELKRSNIDLSILIKRFAKQLLEEKEMIDWSVKLQRTSRSGRFEELKKKGLI